MTRGGWVWWVCVLMLAVSGGCADTIGDDDDGPADATDDTLRPANSCGDGVVDANETCDPQAQAFYSCGALGAGQGQAPCTSQCVLDLTACSEAPMSCGTGTIEAPETCDGEELGGATCESLGLDPGTLACSQFCTFDTRGCGDQPPGCGDGIIQLGEECDGAELDGKTCRSVPGYFGGTLGCGDDCRLDISACTLCGNGVIDAGEVCDDGNNVDDPECSADCSEVCPEGATVCEDGVSRRCEGGQVVTEVCDELQGIVCGANGRCDGACRPSVLGTSYVGCDYFPTVTANAVDDKWTFAVAVSNTSKDDANLTVTRGDEVLANYTVGADSVQIVPMPWIANLKGPDATSSSLSPMSGSIIEPGGAYRLRSTQPVTVYQFSPLEYTNGSSCSNTFSNCTYTNDASLLLPTHVWSDTYRVASRRHFDVASGFVAVTSAQDGTQVTLSASPQGNNAYKGNIPGVDGSGNGTVTLNAGDVLQLVTSSGGDPTGMLVTADRPVQVIGGHQCTFVPDSVQACDHLEEAIFPVATLGRSYIVTAPANPGGGGAKDQYVRVIATAADTTLTYDPPVSGAPASLPIAGGWAELPRTSTDFSITANHPILVVSYMQGQDSGAQSGDPAMAQAVNVEQFRTAYLFHAPTNYEENWVNIVAPEAADVELDGQQISNWSTIGATGFKVSRTELSNSGDGNHRVISGSKVGITVYGYGQYTSYWYPGGLDLRIIN